MTDIGLQKLVTNEMMARTGVSRCLSLRQYDITRSEILFRWFGGGKTVGLRLPRDASESEAFQQVKAAVDAFGEAATAADDAAEFERLKAQAHAAGIGWMECRLSDER